MYIGGGLVLVILFFVVWVVLTLAAGYACWAGHVRASCCRLAIGKAQADQLDEVVAEAMSKHASTTASPRT